MKKNLLAIAAVIMVAGAVTIVACTKDNPINNTQNAQPIQQTSSVKSKAGITIAELTENGIKFRFDKNKVLSYIHARFMKELGKDCIMEDIRISTKKVGKEQVHIVSISYFDVSEEKSVAMFGVLENHSGGQLVLRYENLSARCVGRNCRTGCTPLTTQNKEGRVIVYDCVPCVNPIEYNKPYKCEYIPAQGYIPTIVYEGFQMYVI